MSAADPTPPPAAPEDPPAGEPTEDPTPPVEEDKDWRAEYEAQVRINKTLERKTKKDLAALEELRKAAPPAAAPTADTDVQRLIQQAEQAALEKANTRILAAEVRAAAAGVLADPSDALRLLDLTALDVGDDGMIDPDEIKDAIADLVKQKPYLAAQGGRRWQGDPDAGARKEQKVSQLTRDDLRRLNPEQIVQAKAEGRLNEVLGITTP